MKLTETAETVLERRYYLEGEDWKGLSKRVGTFVADGDTELGELYTEMIESTKFLPNSPCLMNAGTSIGNLSACFVLGVSDDMLDIFTTLRNAAMVAKSGGGTGYSFSRVRHRGAKVRSTNGVASGPLSFMRVFNTATDVIKQGGKRRGANMAVLRIDHPDIVEFICAKEVEGEFANFNLSVGVTDAFMKAVRDGSDYDLLDHNGDVHSSIDAKSVWEMIVHKAWLNGEPGVLFIDEANRHNPTPHLGDFEATNPCGEQYLLPEEACNLGSINLGLFVDDEGYLNTEELKIYVRLATKFLDGVITKNDYPIEKITEMTKTTRKIGLGIMGLHDMLIRMKIAYGSEEGRSKAAEIMNIIHTAAKETSEELGRTKGVFPAYDKNHCKFPPRRNAALTSIQPTGTVSMIADCSSGCEPYFSLVVHKYVMDEQLTMLNSQFEATAKREGFYYEGILEHIAKHGSIQGLETVPEIWRDVFRTAQEISVEEHVLMQSVLQNNGIDSSISKTINLPNSATEEDVHNTYMLGYDEGCKGLTIYRDGSRQVQVLYTPDSEVVVGKSGVVKCPLPDTLNAKRYKVKGDKAESIYIIICFDDDDVPMEVFAKFAYDNRADLRERSTMWTTVCRLLSLALRCGINITEIISQLDKSSGTINDLPSQMSRLLKTFLTDSTNDNYSESCPECPGKITYKEGCAICESCGYNRCS